MTRSMKWIAVVAGLSLFASCGGGGKSGDKAPAGVPVTEPSGTTVLRDDFSNSGSGWDIANTNLFSSTYSGGRFRVEAKVKNLLGISSTLYEGPPERPELKQLGEVDVAVTAVGQPASGGAVGLVCRTRGDPAELDYYGATLSAGGRWSILRQQGKRRSQMSSGAAAGGLKFGTTPVALRLECRGNEADPLRLRLYANGKFLGEGVDPSPWASGGAGFIVASLGRGGVVAFLDDFTLATPT
jgi:hypothetical protein